MLNEDKAEGQSHRAVPVTVLIVEDEQDQRELLADILRRRNDSERFAGRYVIDRVVETDNYESAMTAVDEHQPDIVLLDYELSPSSKGEEGSGKQLCQDIRAKNFLAPVIFVTGRRKSQIDTADFLSAGADDCMHKPYGIDELLARMNARLESFERSDSANLKVGPYRFRPSENWIVRSGERRILLTEKESGILKLLYDKRGAPASRAELLQQVWGYHPGACTHTLQTHVYRLRNKIEENPKEPKILITAPEGYRLNHEESG